jgi:site-specific recombinase XerD
MFEKLFGNSYITTHHKNAPYTTERQNFLKSFIQEGYSLGTLRRTARELLWLVRHLNISPGNKVTFDQIQSATKRWARRQSRCGQTCSPKWTRNSFILTAIRWFRHLGRLQDSIPQSLPFNNLIQPFANWMESERGLSPVTIHVRCLYVRQFLQWYEGRGKRFSAIEVKDIDTYLAANGRKRWNRQSVVNHARALKAFLRYAAEQTWCLKPVAEAIQAPRVYSQETLPMGPPWEDVRRLLMSCKTNKPRDIRSRAVMMFFAIYGLRSGEVSNLKLEDIDWENDRIRVWRPKQRKLQTYPLIPAMGEAIIQYLQQVRPQCSHREIFLTMRPPFRPISIVGLATLVKRHMERLGIHARHRGPHSLRHACATHLVAEGFSLKEIGDHLGHRSPDATQIYAKVDLTGLREVATFDAGGLL